MDRKKNATFAEITEEQCLSENIQIKVNGAFLGVLVQEDFHTAEKMVAPSHLPFTPTYSLSGGECSSEWGTYNFETSFVGFNIIEDEDLQFMDGDRPLGTIIPDDTHLIVYLNVTKDFLHQLQVMLSSKSADLSLRINIPKTEKYFANNLPVVNYAIECYADYQAEIDLDLEDDASKIPVKLSHLDNMANGLFADLAAWHINREGRAKSKALIYLGVFIIGILIGNVL